jgi:bile acid:Na+ symporter, BASS family
MTILLVCLAWAVRLMIFALGLRTTASDVAYLWRRPGLLLRSVLAMYVVVPLAAVLMVKGLDLPHPTRVTLIVLAICAGAPLVPRKLAGPGGTPAYVLSLAVTSSVLAIATVPLSVALLDWLFDARVDIHPLTVARVIGISFLLPFLTGVAVQAWSPSSAQRLVTPTTNIAAAVFLVSACVMLGITSLLIIENGVRSFLALMALTVVALTAGHLLGGPKPEDRVALAVLCATRHIGLVIVVGFARPSREAVAVLSAYIVAALLVSTPYMVWQRRRPGAEATSGA